MPHTARARFLPFQFMILAPGFPMGFDAAAENPGASSPPPTPRVRGRSYLLLVCKKQGGKGILRVLTRSGTRNSKSKDHGTGDRRPFAPRHPTLPIAPSWRGRMQDTNNGNWEGRSTADFNDGTTSVHSSARGPAEGPLASRSSFRCVRRIVRPDRLSQA